MTPDEHAEISMLARDLMRVVRRRADLPAAKDGNLLDIVQEHYAYESVRREAARALVDRLYQHRPREAIFALPSGADITGLVTDLIVANGGWVEPNEDRASMFLTSGRAEAQRVGREMNAIAGWEGMSALGELTAVLLCSVALRELSAAWSGIGEWLD